MPARCRSEDLAEVWLGGLLQADEVSADAENPDEVIYVFRQGVGDVLFDALPRPDARTVLKQVTQYVDENLGRLRRLSAWLTDPRRGQGPFAAGDEPFALVTAHILRRLGGEYARLVESPPDAKRAEIAVATTPDFKTQDIEKHTYPSGSPRDSHEVSRADLPVSRSVQSRGRGASEMSPWSDSAAIVKNLVKQLNQFDWGSVHQTCDALIKQLGQESQPFPLDPAKQILS
jgi:hypothetical protein